MNREWQLAQGHLVEKTVVSEKELEQGYKLDTLAEKTYQKVMGRLDARKSTVDSQMGHDLLEDLLHEKSLDLDKFKEEHPEISSQRELRMTSDRVFLTGKPFKNTELEADELSAIKDEDLQSSIDKLMNVALDASVTDLDGQSKVMKELREQVSQKPAFLRRKRMARKN